jgi:hypothetical protein
MKYCHCPLKANAAKNAKRAEYPVLLSDGQEGSTYSTHKMNLRVLVTKCYVGELAVDERIVSK